MNFLDLTLDRKNVETSMYTLWSIFRFTSFPHVRLNPTPLLTKMTMAFFAGRATTLRRLHFTVRRNILRQHRRNVQHDSAKPSGGPTTSNSTSPRPHFSGSYWAWIEPVKIPFRVYEGMQSRHPLMTQWETTLIIYFLGDLSAQSVQTSFFTEARYEPIRSLRALVIGGIVSIPSFKFFMWLGRHFNYASHLKSLAVKIIVSQSLFTPLFNSYFFGMQSLLSGCSLREAKDRVLATVPVSWKNSWKVWPLVTAFSFTFIRPQNRAVFAGFIAIFWQTYLSWLNRKAELTLRDESTDKSPALATEKSTKKKGIHPAKMSKA